MHSHDMSAVTIHCNSDLSGNLRITLNDEVVRERERTDDHIMTPEHTQMGDHGWWTFEVPAEDIVDFVLDHYLREGVSMLENLIGDGVLRRRLRELEEWTKKTPRV